MAIVKDVYIQCSLQDPKNICVHITHQSLLAPRSPLSILKLARESDLGFFPTLIDDLLLVPYLKRKKWVSSVNKRLPGKHFMQFSAF